MIDSKEYRHSPRSMDRAFRKSAESWWIAALSFKIGIFIVGALAIFLSLISQIAPFFIAILSVISELCSWRSSAIRDTWEALHRDLDARDSFGWPISRAKFSDWLTQSSQKLRDRLSAEEAEETYFASTQTPGPKRAVENVQESAWWAKHLARRAGNFYTAIVIILMVGSIAVLIVSIETIEDFDVLPNIGRVVTAAIMLVFSLDLLRLSRAYYKYSRKAARVERRAERLLSNDTVDLVQAIKLMQEYHLAHAEAPMNPHWIWKLMRDDLNELWQTYRRRD